MSTGRVLVVAAVCLFGATACETSKLTGAFDGQRDDPTTTSSVMGDPAVTGTVAAAGAAEAPENASDPQILGKNPHDDLSLGKKYFHSGNFGLAEKHFRHGVEQHPRDAESWVGLAATYDRLKRFDLADRAYAQAARIVGETPELMNNRGFSYILRGDYKRARRTLLAAQSKAPDNPYIKNNLDLLEKTKRRGKSIN
jgi:Flp pilus assembly protein TadD